jgi:hypothetical protein
LAAKKHHKSAPAQDQLLNGPALFARFLRLTEKWSDVNRLHEWPVSNAYLSQLRSGKLDAAKMRSSTLAKLSIAVREVERRQAFEAAYVASQPAAPADALAAPAASNAFEHPLVPGQLSSEAPFIEHVLYMAGRIAELAHQIQIASQRQTEHLETLATAARAEGVHQALSADEIARVRHAAEVTSAAPRSRSTSATGVRDRARQKQPTQGPPRIDTSRRY